MNKLPLIITAVSPVQAQAPALLKAIANWRERATSVVIVAAKGTPVPQIPFVQIHETPYEPRLNDLVDAIVKYAFDPQSVVCLTDAYAWFTPDIWRVADLAEEKQLGLSWVATSTAIDERLQTEPLGLRCFIACRQVFGYVANYSPENITLDWPVWSGWLAHFVAENTQPHKYFDVSALRAVHLFDGPGAPIDASDELLTFNPPALALP